jgi:hypothetical protein
MKRCETCGNEYERAFKVEMGGKQHFFDSFECAIFKLAPRCETCGVAIAGHGVEVGKTIYCSSHCARGAGVEGTRDHA